MQFDERDDGDYRIYGGALDAPNGGFLAAVVVMRLRNCPGEAQVVFRDERLSCGHRFAAASDALRHAMDAGRRALRS